jgi:uncharacterized protein YlzI (FlbEa/FlbD family)
MLLAKKIILKRDIEEALNVVKLFAKQGLCIGSFPKGKAGMRRL